MRSSPRSLDFTREEPDLTHVRKTTAGPADRIWERLSAVRRVRFRARWRNARGEEREAEGDGSARVEYREGDPATIVTVEEGVWEPVPGSVVRFRGGYRWTREGSGIRLEHVRRGRARAVFLAELIPGPGGRFLRSRWPHLCGDDRYEARLRATREGVWLDWHVRGPHESQHLAVRYR